MAFNLPPLPYDQNALEPFVSATTMDFHYNKHHQTYLNNLNNLVADTIWQDCELEQIIMQTAAQEQHVGLFNNAAQVWNHTFFWSCMKPHGGGNPGAALTARLNESFGTLDSFKDQFKQAALGQFGSGWAWLVDNNGVLEIMKTTNADLPMAYGKKALLTCDVWEHAYYLDYQNKRADFVQVFLDKLVNWEFAEANLLA